MTDHLMEELTYQRRQERLAKCGIVPTDARKAERYPYVVAWTDADTIGRTHGPDKTGWVGLCCRGCHGCGGAPVTDAYPLPIEAHLARLEWLGEVPVGPVRVIECSTSK